MLKHYLEEISALEFSERDLEIERSVAQEKGVMNSRDVLYSSMTVQALADFFAAEFRARCDFLKNFVVSHSGLMIRSDKVDAITAAKTLFQTKSFEQREKMMAFYQTSIEAVIEPLISDMPRQIEDAFAASMEARIKKNNLYVEVAYQAYANARTDPNPILMLQPNFNGIGVDLVELWNRYIKHDEKSLKT